MAQQVFNQWAPVAKAQNEQGQEVYLPFAGIHAQTRDGKDEIIVGAGNMVWTGSMWVPVSNQNRLPVEATLSGQIEVLYEGPVSTITAGSSVAVVPKRRTEFREVRGGIAVSSANRGDWQLYVLHLHDAGGNYFGSEDLVRLTDNMVGGGGAKNLLSSHFEVRVLNNNSFDAGVYRVSILGVR